MEAKTETDKIIKFIDEINDRIWLERGTTNDMINPMEMGREAHEKAIQINYRYGIYKASLNMGMGKFLIERDNDAAIESMNFALNGFTELNDKKWVANTQLTLGILYNSLGNSERALYNSLRGIDYYEHHSDNGPDPQMGYYVVGTVYKDLKKYEEAERFYRKGLEVSSAESFWGARIYNGLSNIFNEQEKYEEALNLARSGMKTLKANNNSVGVSRSLTDMGIIYRKQKDYDNALSHFFEGLRLREESNIKQFMVTSLIEIAVTYSEAGNKTEALNYFLKAEGLAVEINLAPKLGMIYQSLAGIYKLSGQFKESLGYYEKYFQLTIEQTKKEKETSISNLQNSLVKEKEQEIERIRNVELKSAYDLITEKNKEITDSIHYARRIQKALLASDDLLKNNLPPHFVLYKPKDIVSGDFYWAIKKEERFYLAVCDSTGHGVPGAFMSLLNISFLNEAITDKNIKEPHLILNHVRSRLIETISQDGAQDGMDGILVCFEKDRISYSAANNPPMLISNGKSSVLPSDKMPIGKGEKNNSFTTHEVKPSPDDALYLYTDGYADQFGGPNGKKFKYKQLEQLIFSQHKAPLQQQADVLNAKLNEWKGDLEQVDDVLIIGLRF